MNLFKNMLFLQGHLTNPRDTDDADEVSYARGYGNQVASRKVFAPLGHALANDRAAHQAADLHGQELCTASGCRWAPASQ